MLTFDDYVVIYGCVFIVATIVVVVVDVVMETSSTPRQNLLTALGLVFWPILLLASPWIVKRRIAQMERHQQRCERSNHADCQWWKKENKTGD